MCDIIADILKLTCIVSLTVLSKMLQLSEISQPK